MWFWRAIAHRGLDLVSLFSENHACWIGCQFFIPQSVTSGPYERATLAETLGKLAATLLCREPSRSRPTFAYRNYGLRSSFAAPQIIDLDRLAPERFPYQWSRE